jgi:hypothetical protein
VSNIIFDVIEKRGRRKRNPCPMRLWSLDNFSRDIYRVPPLNPNIKDDI